eukprot:7097321-Alexandrium_andersonii.AAC.1
MAPSGGMGPTTVSDLPISLLGSMERAASAGQATWNSSHKVLMPWMRFGKQLPLAKRETAS